MVPKMFEPLRFDFSSSAALRVCSTGGIMCDFQRSLKHHSRSLVGLNIHVWCMYNMFNLLLPFLLLENRFCLVLYTGEVNLQIFVVTL